MGPIPKFSSRWVTINVNRNLFAPRHTQTTWSKDIMEDLPVGSSVIQVFGYDNDTKVRSPCLYFIQLNSVVKRWWGYLRWLKSITFKNTF